MKKTLLFVREKAKDSFIETANNSLKFANNLSKEAKKAGFDDLTAWEVAKIAYRKPTPAQLESAVKNLIISKTEKVEIAGLNISVKKLVDMVEMPNLWPINALIERENEIRTDLGIIPFEKIRNDKNIELDSDWLTEKLEEFTVYAENEGQAKTFQVFTDIVKNINKLADDRNKRQYFEPLIMEGFCKWEDSEFVIETKAQSLARLFMLFGTSEESINKRSEKALRYSGDK